MDSEVIKVHIWELSEKTDDIDKSNEYIMIHDGYALKKVLVEKLYEYFVQDYKIDNLVSFIETSMETENMKYEALYSDLSLSIDTYSNIIEDLQDKFTSNKYNIRIIESSSNKMDYDMDTLSVSYESIKNKISKLSESNSELNTDISNLQKKNDNLDSIKEELTVVSDDLNNIIKEVNENNDYINNTIETINNNISMSGDVKHKGDEFSKIIHDEYDKLLAIIDYYHHIHEKDIP